METTCFYGEFEDVELVRGWIWLWSFCERDYSMVIFRAYLSFVRGS